MQSLQDHLAPDENDLDEFKYQMNAVTMMCDHLKTAPLLFWEHIEIGFHVILRMKLQYPIDAMCFIHKQCTKIQSWYLPTFLYKMGINLQPWDMDHNH